MIWLHFAFSVAYFYWLKTKLLPLGSRKLSCPFPVFFFEVSETELLKKAVVHAFDFPLIFPLCFFPSKGKKRVPENESLIEEEMMPNMLAELKEKGPMKNFMFFSVVCSKGSMEVSNRGEKCCASSCKCGLNHTV